MIDNFNVQVLWKYRSVFFPYLKGCTEAHKHSIMSRYQNTTGFIGVAWLVNFNKHFNQVIPLRQHNIKTPFVSTNHRHKWIKDGQSRQATETFDKLRVDKSFNTFLHLKPACNNTNMYCAYCLQYEKRYGLQPILTSGDSVVVVCPAFTAQSVIRACWSQTLNSDLPNLLIPCTTALVISLSITVRLVALQY